METISSSGVNLSSTGVFAEREVFELSASVRPQLILNSQRKHYRKLIATAQAVY